MSFLLSSLSFLHLLHFVFAPACVLAWQWSVACSWLFCGFEPLSSPRAASLANRVQFYVNTSTRRPTAFIQSFSKAIASTIPFLSLFSHPSIHSSIHSPFTINSFSSAKYSDFVYYVRLPQLVDVHYIVHFIKDAWRSEESLIITKRSFRLLSPKTNLDSANFIVNKVTWKFWL